MPGWRRDARGTELAEAAIVLPLLFLVLIAIYWFGQAFRIYGTITHAAREGARAAVAPLCATCGGTNDPSQNALNAIKSALLANNLDPNLLQQPSTSLTLTGCVDGKTVSCDGGTTQVCIQGVTQPIQLATISIGGAGECGVSVSFQYPYSLALPGSSLNRKVIYLRAQAQMRVESQ
jgi:Flp pilus assembly protein TadG